MSSIGKKVPTQEEIEQRAYQIYLQRGGSHGGEVDGWLAAEKERFCTRIRRDPHFRPLSEER